MPCLNQDNLPYLLTYGSMREKIIIDENPAVRYANTQGYDFIYIQISTDDSFKKFPLASLLSSDDMENIKSARIFLIIDNSLEFFLTSADAIYQDIVIKEGIPAEQIIFFSGVPTMIEHVRELSRKYSLPEIKVEWFSLFEDLGKNAITMSTHSRTLRKTKYDKRFLNLNRRWRLHRPLMMTLLHSRNLLEKGYISFAPSDDGKDWNTAHAELLRHYHNHPRIGQILQDHSSVRDLQPMYLDTEDLVTNRAIHEPSINRYYEDTAFSVISETTYHEGIPFLSEKTFKAIGMRHPFILATAPNSLQYLKQLGYKTFHPLIDETYDGILDHGDRMLSIVDEIERLCNLDDSQFKIWMGKISRICSYNRTVLERKQTISRRMN